MKKDGVSPDLRVYGYLCTLFANKALWPEVAALCHDAVAVGLTLDVTMYNWKLAVSRCSLLALRVPNAQNRPVNLRGYECGESWMKWMPMASLEMH
jgi:hypothetical protein